MAENPLLEISALPNHAPDFDAIKNADFLPGLKAAITEAHENVKTIKDSADAPGFENSVLALENASESLDQVLGVFHNLLSAVGGDELHALAEEIGPLSAAFSSDIILDAELFSRVKDVYEQRHELNLTVEQKMLLEESYKGFVRGGALLNANEQGRLREISQLLSVLGPSFMNNVSKSAEAFELLITDETQIAGLPDNALAAARQAAQEKGHDLGWLISLDFPSYMPFMQFAEDRTLREKVWRAYGSKAYQDDYDNCETVLSTVKLKHERANLLGYETHAAYVLEERMAKATPTVHAFLDKLKKTYKPAAEKDLKRLRDFAEETDGLLDFQPWDVPFYSEKLKEQLFDFSSEDLRPYFQLDRVLEGCFAHFTKLFGLIFEQNAAYATWHEDVKAFDLFRENDHSFMGTLYADFHPRTGKKPGAWMSDYRAQGLWHGNVERPVVGIFCNFTKPTPDRPTLITHSEVTTLFHEMGHAMHALLSDVTYRSLSGTSVKWDFVELPSQVQENWCYEKETLDLFASHFETGEPIPQSLIDKLRKAKNFMGGMAGLRQISFGILDMAWHSKDPSSITDVAAFEDRETADTALFPRLAGPMSNSFGHLFAGGYSAGYYSYKWAEVLDADAFEMFLEQGLYDQSTAQRYQKEVLAKGGTEHPGTLYEKFRGRAADPDALLRREGLIGSNTS